MKRGWDFFLQAHKALQGTVSGVQHSHDSKILLIWSKARPAHYVIVHDEIKLGANQLEQVTHALCYLFGRATKAVSICPPAYYADLLCERGRCYLYSMLNSEVPAYKPEDEVSTEFDWNTSPWLRGVHQK